MESADFMGEKKSSLHFESMFVPGDAFSQVCYPQQYLAQERLSITNIKSIWMGELPDLRIVNTLSF